MAKHKNATPAARSRWRLVIRRAAAAEANRFPANTRIFFNLHPAEIADDSLPGSLRELRDSFAGSQEIVIEVHEGTVADLETLTWLRNQLKERGIGLAYDDFGTGQSRLTELAEIPPDFIKLDRSLV